MSSRRTSFENFRDAAHGLGKYCAVKNELRIRKGRKIYLFTCGEFELRFTDPGGTTVVVLIAPDATVDELRRGINWLTGERATINSE